MPTLRPSADAGQAERLAAHLATAERELRLAVAHTGGLTRRRAGQLVDMVRRLQVARLELRCEAPDRERDPSCCR